MALKGGNRMGKELLSYGIIAGGQSRRMGMDKASLKLNNQTFLNQLMSEFEGKGPLMISVRDKHQGEEIGRPYLEDINLGIGPIEGIKNLIQWSPTDYIFICACDMPFLKYGLVEYMAGHLSLGYDGYVMEDGERVHPLCGIYSKPAAVRAVQMIQKQNYRLMHLLEQINIKNIDIRQSGVPASCLRNINTKEEYIRYINAC